MTDQPTAELDAAELLAAPPRKEPDEGEAGYEYALLELSLTFPQLDVAPERLALWLRLFVITQDPLSWIANRGHAWAALNSDGRVLEVGVYLDLEELERARAAAGGDLATALGRYGETAMKAVFAHEQALVGGGRVPRLLEDIDGYACSWGVPAVHVRSHGWEQIGLGALQDLVHDAFGNVDLDRSAVALAPVEPPADECPACEGESFAFPSGLEQAEPHLCAPHAAAAAALRIERLARARASNPAGWRAIDKAVARINGTPEPVFAPLPKRTVQSVSRNEPCPCGSGLKYKRCHGA